MYQMNKDFKKTSFVRTMLLLLKTSKECSHFPRWLPHDVLHRLDHLEGIFPPQQVWEGEIVATRPLPKRPNASNHAWKTRRKKSFPKGKKINLKESFYVKESCSLSEIASPTGLLRYFFKLACRYRRRRRRRRRDRRCRKEKGNLIFKSF